jgi:nucleoside-diphosphate-sugar epimerase
MDFIGWGKILAVDMGSIHSSAPAGVSPAPVTGATLVLGASGRVGRLLADAWRQAPPPFRLLWQWRAAGQGGEPGALVWDPLAEPQRLAAIAERAGGIGVLVSLAGVVAGEDLARNTDLGLAALEAARGAGVGHVFLASSAAVYGDSGPGPVAEDAALRPVSPYGAAKAAMEAAVREWSRASGGPGVSCLRIGNVAGADALLTAAKTGSEAPVRLDCDPEGRSPRRSYIGPGALGLVLAALVERAGQGGALPFALNLGLPGPVAMADLLDAAGIPWVARPVPAAPAAHAGLDLARLEALCPFVAGLGGAAAIVADWRAHDAQAPGGGA